MPRFSGFLNIETLEAELAKSYRQSLQEKALHLDLRNLEWISPLSLSVIYSWAWEIISAHGSATIIPPQLDSFAASFFNSADVLARFKSRHLSVDTTSRGGKMFLKRKIAAFEVFHNRGSFETYIGNLNDEPQRSLLLHSDDPPELVSSGHFHRIVLQELIDNTFAHTDGSNSHYVAFEADSAQSGTRKAHAIISPMSGQGYIEVCVADSSKRNLVDTLKRFLPPSYQPLGAMDLYKNHKKLDPIELCILYAFEYGSTSKREERVRKIAEWLAQPAESASGIATGLYNVLSLAKFYGGQVIVRTAGRLGTLDFSDYGHGFPRIAFWNSLRGAKLARLKGTIILIRVPVRRVGTEKYVMPKPRQQAETSRGKQPAIRVISPRTNASSPSNLTEILLDLEQRVTEALRFGISTPNIVAVVLDGLALPSKAFGAFLELLARIPRYRSALVVITDDPQDTLAAAEQWERIRDSASGPDEFLRQPAFLLTVDHTTAASIYGSHEHTEATVLMDNRAVLPFGESVPLEELIDPIRTQRLREALAQPPVCHESGLYLIESAYYTERFYEVHGLLVNELTRRTLVLWLRSEFMKVNPDVVIYNATFLEPVLREALRPLNDSGRKIQLLPGRHDNVVSLALEATMAAGKNGRVIVVLDVLCTARFIGRFLDVLPSPDSVEILALVDARDSDTFYLSVARSAGSVDVQVKSVLRERLRPIYDRPTGISARDILLVDSVTHAPTRYPLPDKAGVDDTVLLERAGQVGALANGHFVLKDRHYLYFLSFREAFAELQRELEQWLQNQFQELIATAGVEPKLVRTYCLDEDTGLFQVVERVLRNNDLQGPRSVMRSELSAPPVLSEQQGSTAWFVLPAMASGTTIQHCLEYGKALGMARVHVSVVVARVAPDILRFYQSINEYRGMGTLFQFMCSLPLLSYWESRCPACALGVSLQAALEKIGHTRPHLREMLKAMIQEVEPIYAQSAGRLGPESSRKGSLPAWREARARADYERARRDVEARSALMREFAAGDGGEALAGAVGRGPSDPAFLAGNLNRIVYAPERLSEACREWATKTHTEPEDFSRQLRGFAQIVPRMLRELLRDLVTRYVNHPRLYERLLTEAVRQPELFWEAIERSPEPADEKSKEALRELRNFVRRGGGGLDSAGVWALHELRWHLVRSSGWGMPLEMIRMKLRLPGTSREELLKAFERFLREGFHEADRRLRVAQNTGTVWVRLTHWEPHIEEYWDQVCTAMQQVNVSINSFEGTMQGTFDSIDKLEQARRKFVDGLDRIALRPGPAMAAIKQLSEQSERTATRFTVRVAENCPSIAITEDDFQEAIFLLLENALYRRGKDEGNETHFEFAATMSQGPIVLLQMTQSSPWRPPETLEGGLARVRELLAHHGASMQITPSVDPLEPFLKIRFIAWPIESRPDTV